MSKELSIGIIGRTGSMGRWFKDFFSGAGYKVMVSGRKTEITYTDIIKECMEPSVHDRHMAVVQGLNHFLTICMGRTLQKLNMDAGSALSCSTPVFRINYDLAGRLFAQDLGLYKSIINNKLALFRGLE